MKLQKRLEALEAALINEPTLLRMPGGSTASLPGRGDHLLRLFDVAVGGAAINREQAAQLKLIRQSTGSREPGGGHMTDLIRCFLHGPAKAPN
jgi:hypothetical protein